MKNDKKIIIEKIKNKNVVSFDVFDTAILRNINSPLDVFKILGKYVEKEFGISNFYDIRIASEKKARNKENNMEASLDDIYNEILKIIRKKEIISVIKKKEIELEYEFCVKNEFIYDLYKYCIENKKRVLFISDMYLSNEIIENILVRNGYDEKNLYVSCECKKSKGTGELYKYILNNEKILNDEWIHIGDNTLSDFEMPIKLGIDSIKYHKVNEFSNIEPKSIYESIMLGIRNNYLYCGKDCEYWEKFGVENASFIHFGFTEWLYKLTKKKDNLFFLSRDGYFIQKVYELFNREKKVFTKYIYCSRASCQIPALIYEEKERAIAELTDCYLNEMKLSSAFEDLGIDSKKIDMDILNAYEIDLNDMLEYKNIFGFRKVCLIYFDSIYKKLVEKLEITKKYLIQEEMDNFDTINVMDIGWTGTIQTSIKKILNKNVKGYYFGTLKRKNRNTYEDMFGYYFDSDDDIIKRDFVLDNVMMFEFMFSAPHGSTLGYEFKENKLAPIINQDIDHNNVQKKIQSASINIIKTYLSYYEYFDELHKDFCLEPYINFIKNKNIEDRVEFSKIGSDFLLNSNKIKNYSYIIKEKDLHGELNELLLKINNNFWNGSYVFEDKIENKEYFKKLIDSRFSSFKCKEQKDFDYAFVYFDKGKGFNEEDKEKVYYIFDKDNYLFEIDLPKNVKRIRIDPIEGSKIIVRDLVIKNMKKKIKFIVLNTLIFSKIFRKKIYVNDTDPRILIKNHDYKRLKFCAKLTLID